MPKKNEYTISIKHNASETKETSDSIAEQIKLFLKSGGQIDKIPSGVSGQISLGEKVRLAREEQQRKKEEQQEKREKQRKEALKADNTESHINGIPCPAE